MAFTIKLLEVRLEVQGGDYEREFTRMFNDHMARYQRRLMEEQQLQRLADFERGLGDHEDGH